MAQLLLRLVIKKLFLFFATLPLLLTFIYPTMMSATGCKEEEKKYILKTIIFNYFLTMIIFLLIFFYIYFFSGEHTY